MSGDKTLKHVRAMHPLREGRGTVNLYGFAQWIKSEPMVNAWLTPRQARVLAVELLAAAELAEDIAGSVPTGRTEQ